jgi:hypothetical protein
MLVMKERQPPFRTAERWARLVLLEIGAIRECEGHGWMRIAAILVRASAPFSSRDTSRLSVSLRSERLLRFATCWMRSETPVQSARPSNRGRLARASQK